MNLWHQIKRVARFDLALFHGRKRLALACLGVMCVPAIYATIYLSSTWDPYSKVSNLQVAVVNLDQAITVREREVNLGASIVERLEEKHAFTLKTVATEQEARDLVTSSEAAFAVIIPRDLTASAMRATAAEPGHVRVLFSEGNNYLTGTVAKRFADELARNTNEVLNTERWSVVLDTVDQSKDKFAKLKDGVGKLRDGADQLDDGLARAHEGATKLDDGAHRAAKGSKQLVDGATLVAAGTTRLTTGIGTLGDGLQQMEAAMPAQSTLDQLSAGAHRVADGQSKLTAGLQKLSDGTGKARDGATKLKDGTAGIPIVGGKISAGAGQLEAGLAQLEAGATTAHDGSAQLATGGQQVAGGVDALTAGMTRLTAGVHTINEKMPTADQLAKLSAGSHKVATGTKTLNTGLSALADGTAQLEDGLGRLHDGAGRLKDGLHQLEDALPTRMDALSGDARGLATSITPQLESLTPIGAYGNSMVPYFLGLSLWIGVVIIGFVFQLRWFPQRLRTSRGLALVLGRLAVPWVVVLGQATLLTLALKFGLHATMPSFWKLWLISLVTSTVFLSVLVMLIGLLGDVGKVIALLFLVFQMGASGGVFPLAMTSDFFRVANPFLPFSWVLRAARAALFGAYDGNWFSALSVLALFGLGAVGITALGGRWKFVPRHRFGPLMDVD